MTSHFISRKMNFFYIGACFALLSKNNVMFVTFDKSMAQNSIDYSLDFDRTSSILNVSQTNRLLALLDSAIVISSPMTLINVNVIPWRFLIRFQNEAKQRQLDVKNIRLSGGAASFVLDPNGDFAYRDLDFLISIDGITSDKIWSNLKDAVFSALPVFDSTSNEMYAEKLIRIVTEQDRWALISLRNGDGRNLELVKMIFVDLLEFFFSCR